MADMPDPDPTKPRLLRTKLLVPPMHAELVPRDRLIRRLDACLDCKLTLISAPAGFGKTTLLSDWIARRDVAVAWVSLDERDNDPSRFWAYVIAALQTVWSEVGERAAAMLQTPNPPPIEGVLAILLNDLAAQDSRAVLVLDDYHAISDEEIHRAFEFVLDHLPPSLHLIVAGRADPPLPLARLRARRQLMELRGQDLRFTLAETQAFLERALGSEVAAEDLDALDSLTEGWAAGLQLAVLSMQDVEDMSDFLGVFSGSHRYVFDYLAEEILNRQPAALRTFLIQSAVLDRMSGPLCNAVLARDDSQDVLEHLEAANLFIVPLDQHRRWYRYHHLFTDFLKVRLAEQLSEREISKLHHRASDWYAQQGLAVESVPHALAAKDYDLVRSLIRDVVPDMFANSELRTLMGWLGQLPRSLLKEDAYLSMTAAWALRAMGRAENIEEHLQDVEHLIGAAADGSAASFKLDKATRGALGEISAIRATLAFDRMDMQAANTLSRWTMAYLDDPDIRGGPFNQRLALQAVATFELALAQEYSGETASAVSTFKEAIELLREDQNPHLLPMAISNLAQLQMIQGDLHAAAQTYDEALATAETMVVQSPLSGIAYTGLGTLLYEWNDLERAADYLARGLEIGHPWFHWEIMLAGSTGLALIDQAHGHPEQATARLDALLKEATQMGIPWALPVVEAYQALLAVRQRRIDAAARWVHTMPSEPQDSLSYLQEAHTLILVRVLVAMGEVDAARRWTARIIEQAAAAGRLGYVIEALVFDAAACDVQGDHPAALRILARALELAEPQGHIRTFVDAGPRIASLLRQVKPKSPYVDRLLAAFDSAGTGVVVAPEAPVTTPSGRTVPRSALLLDPLTERELEVLALLGEGLTNRKIADQLFVSVNTVKTHVKHIYDKLDVHNRAQATARAVDLGLI